MCGVVGVYCYDEKIASKVAYYSLFSLQHRGQESAGIATLHKNKVYLHKSMGLLSEVFSHDILNKLNGNYAIGHVRYSTTGESKMENAQPLLVRSKAGVLAVSHNGNLVNYWDLRKKLEEDGRVFLTDSDTEVIAQLLSNYLLKHDISDSLHELSKKIVGSYALTMIINDKMVAFRDPLGFKPLCVGEGDFGYVIASESCAIDTVGAEMVRDVKPGEAVVIEDGNIEFVKIVKSTRRAVCVFEYIYFARPDSVIDGVSVYESRHNMGRILAKESYVDADIVSSIPDSGITASIGFSHESGIPYLEALIKNRYVGRTFIMPEQKLREFSVKLKVNTVKRNVEGKRVILIDDSIVRGTTSKKIVEMVRKAGAKEVHFRVGSPPIISPCYFGIDMSTREELIASNKSVEEIKKLLNADTLAYLSLDGLLKAVGLGKEELCLSCLTSLYPVKVPGEKSC